MGPFYTGGAGILIVLHQGLGYDVQITISRCYFTRNVGEMSAHFHLEISSNCSVLVKDSRFTFANRIAEDDQLELVPAAPHKFAIAAKFFHR